MAALTGQTPAATYKDLLQVSNSNSGIDATMRAVSDGEGTASLLYLSSAGVAVNTGLNIGAATAVTGGKVTQTASLAAATGNEVAYSLAYTTNKGSSGDDTGLEIVQTDTASPGTSYLINAKVATTSKFYVDNGTTVTIPDGSQYRISTDVGIKRLTASYIEFSNGSTARGGFLSADGYWSTSGTNNYTFAVIPSATAVVLNNSSSLKWSSDANAGNAAGADVGLLRSAAGVVKVTDASTGYGALELDTNSRQYADTVTLTDGSATEVVEIALADKTVIGGRLMYTLTAIDASFNVQASSGSVTFSAVRNDTTYDSDIAEDITPVFSESAGAGSLADTWAIAASAGKAIISVTADSNLTTPTVTCRYHLILHSSQAVTKKT